MYITKTRQLARQHIKDVRRGSTIFNDRLKDGRRSLKVWGWSLAHYESFQHLLKAEGFNSEIVSTPKRGFWAKPGDLQYRIHVWEETEVDPLDDFNYVGSRHHY